MDPLSLLATIFGLAIAFGGKKKSDELPSGPGIPKQGLPAGPGIPKGGITVEGLEGRLARAGAAVASAGNLMKTLGTEGSDQGTPPYDEEEPDINDNNDPGDILNDQDLLPDGADYEDRERDGGERDR